VPDDQRLEIQMAKRDRFELRLPAEDMAMVNQAAQAGGFRSANAYIQAVLTRDLRGSKSDRSNQEAFVAASIDRLSKEIRGLHTGQQALFATIDSLTRLSSPAFRSHRPRCSTRRSAGQNCGMTDFSCLSRKT